MADTQILTPVDDGHANRLPAPAFGNRLAPLTGFVRQPSKQRRGQQVEAQTVIVDPIGQVGQLIQVLAQAAAEGQPILITELEKTPFVGFQQLQQLP